MYEAYGPRHISNNHTSTAVVFLDIEKAFDPARHPGFLYKLHKLKFSRNLIKLISSFLSDRKFTVSVDGEMSKPREVKAGVPQGSVLFQILYSMYINNTPPPPKHQELIWPSLPMTLVHVRMPRT
jgi:hypothetical protein